MQGEVQARCVAFPSFRLSLLISDSHFQDTILGMGSRTLYALPHLVSAHVFRIPLPPPPQSVLEARKRDDDTIYGAPGIGDTYFESMHDIDTVTDTLMEGVLSLQQLPFSQDVSVDFMDEQGNVSTLYFQSKRKSDPKSEEPRTSEPFDEYTRELIVRLLCSILIVVSEALIVFCA